MSKRIHDPSSPGNQSIATESGDTIPNSPKTRAFFEQQTRSRNDGVNVPNNPLVGPENISRGVDILRLIPDGPAARLAFHELAEMKVEGAEQEPWLDAHHAQFIYIDGKASLSDGEGYDSGGGATSTGNEKTPETPEDVVYRGHYRLSFVTEPFTQGGKWVMGKGVNGRHNPRAQNVDILLAAPGSKQRRRIAAAHAFLRMHPLSGAWIISAGTKCNKSECFKAEVHGPALLTEDTNAIIECDHEPIFLDGTRLRHGECRALTRPRTTLVLGGLRFWIQFYIDTTEKEDLYVDERTAFLLANSLAPLERAVSGIPLETDILTPFAVFRKGLGSGAFGSVYEGFHPKTGSPRAVKRLQVTNLHKQSEIEREIQINTRFSGKEGIVTCFGWCNAYGEQIMGHQMPFDIFLVQEKGISFADYCWGSEDAGWEHRGRLMKQLLSGVSTIHAAASMHRDITPMNILYFPNEPSHAALCDFGKLHDAATDTNTALAAWSWLPPEIVYHKDPQKRRMYDQKIDIWMLALALARSWFRIKLTNKQLDLKQHKIVVGTLAEYATKLLPARRKLAALLVNMLEWSPEHRPTAEAALHNPWLKSLETAETGPNFSPAPEKKRLRE